MKVRTRMGKAHTFCDGNKGKVLPNCNVVEGGIVNLNAACRCSLELMHTESCSVERTPAVSGLKNRQ